MSGLPGEASPELRVHCLDCGELDFTIRMSAIALSAAGARSATREKLLEILEYEGDCGHCGDLVTIEIADGEEVEA